MRTGYFVGQSRFVETRDMVDEEEMPAHKNTIDPVLWRATSILSEKTLYSMKNFFIYK